MTFLNWAMLAALAAVAIPILIHLLNRQKATVVDWGAMRFLMESLTSRSRRILLEEIILMALRCMIVALIVLAMARPFLPSRTTIPWAVVLPTMLAAAMLVGIAAAMWSSVRRRWALLAAAAVLTTVALGGSVLENIAQGKLWSLTGGERDVAILIDGSTSMTIPVDGQPNFARAVEEARALINACNPADAVSLTLAGPVPRPVIGVPTSDREDLSDALRTLVPTGGSMRIIDSLSAATAALADGHNPAKKIVVLTDGQNLGWDARNDARWQFLADGFKHFPNPPQIVVRTFGLPPALRNAALTDLKFSRKVVGTDRTVRIDATVSNTGTTPLEHLGVELLVDGASVTRADSAELAPGSSETVRFDWRFTRPGPHVVMARVLSEDQVASDNSAVRVLPVIDRLPVLVVEGDPSVRPLEGAASFIEIALTPPDEDGEPAPAAKKSDKPGMEERLGSLVQPKIVSAMNLGAAGDLRAYSLIILANVPKLPAATASSLVRFVQDGGGLLIVAGDKVMPSFYNAWTSEGGQPFVPAMLGVRKTLEDAPAHFGLKTFSHPALELVRDTTQSDAERALITAYWTLAADAKDVAVRVAGLFDTGDPVLVERKVGKGTVLMTAVALDHRESNLPGLKCFVPLVHELAYHLAAPALAQTNVAPGAEFVVELPAKTPEALKKAADFARLTGDVRTPGNRRLPAALAASAAGLRATFTATYEPGLYHLALPAVLAADFVLPPGAEKDFPFAVLDSGDEGRLVPLTEAEFDAAGRHVNLFHAPSMDQMVQAVTGEVPGEELWRYLAVALLVALAAEIGLTRWVATQRRMHVVDTVAFGPEAVDVQTFRDRARGLLATARREPQGASKA